eukprot:CAMPEP_0198328028 /NCGR_PEP_ID=MMETSP1450-20131203/15161_1 /TAXON_ID=753684 ORGANISM="Madagascaria erythrocladiodes, Strain CCMP3234" /NCGR_SAMPLE_ID=MMETSP1450 /ASSEMBLY_ACC=CAM_ASM_001115 /LENGTH=137 /DNA_ID=CAMNT_0044032115 /DNA_START=147 /DNA_END=560 /DNA_ORIENTATION=+
MTEIDMQGKLTVNVIGGNNFGHGADCYVTVWIKCDSLLGHKKKCAMRTRKDRNAEHPKWDFNKTINLKGRYEGIIFRVKDAEFFKDKNLGEVEFTAEDINSGGKSGTFPCGNGSLELSFQFDSQNVFSEFSSESPSD